MHKTSIFVFVLLFLGTLAVIPAYAEPTWVSVGGPSMPEKPSADIINSDETSTTITFTTTGFWSEIVDEGAVTFQRLSFPEYHTTMEVGKPEIPAIVGLVRIPGMTDVSVSVTGFTQETLTGYNVYPYQAALLETESSGPFVYDQDCYELDQVYPTVTTDITDPAIWRDIRMVKLMVYPIRHKPVTGDLIVYTDITIQLDYSGTNPINQLETTDDPISPRYDVMYNQAILNYDGPSLSPESKGSSSSALTTGYDYLIISRDDYIANLTPFVTWKTTQGLAVQVAPLSTVGSTVTAIKNYITQEYNVNGIQYVLLVGNESDIPGYTGYGSFSDYYYSLVAGGDNYPDLAIGRLCVHSAADVDLMVSKSVTYESNPPPGDWLNNVLLIANFEQAPGKYQGCKEEIRTASYSVQTPNFTTAYGASYANGGDEATNAMVKAWINSGQRVVNYRGHGDLAEWWYWNIWGESFYNSDVYDLANGQMTPVVFSIACWNGNIEWSSTCFAEAFTLHDYGASAILAASRPSYTTANHTYDKKLFKAIYDEGINSVGDASNLAAIEIINYHGSAGLANARMYLWFGDPTLNVIYIPSEEPLIIATSPTQNELDVAAGVDISVTFDMPMDPLTIDNSSFIVYARSTGFQDGTINYDTLTNTAWFYPLDDFQDGDLITVMLTTGIESASGVAMEDSYTWSFTIEASRISPGTFAAGINYVVGNQPFGIFAADLDGDRIIDLVTSNRQSDNISVLANSGDGTFDPQVNYNVGYHPSQVYAADFNHDADLDLALTFWDLDSVRTFMNDGTGAFSLIEGHSTDNDPFGIAVADLDGDGDLDMALTQWSAGSISVFLNNGDNTFAFGASYAVSGRPCNIKAGDLDNDGDLDLVSANTYSDVVCVLMNLGGATFSGYSSYPAGDCPEALGVADFDNDGDLDLAAANKCSFDVSILLNDGSGIFSTDATYALGTAPISIVAFDFDGDGDIDLAAANTSSDNVSVVLNAGDGTFGPQSVYAAGDVPGYLCAADFDGDGDIDLAVENQFDNNVTVLMNRPTSPPIAPTLVSPANGVYTTDYPPTLNWNNVEFADTYEVVVDNDPNFGSIDRSQSGLAVSHWTVSPGIYNDTWYWKARAHNEAGAGPWSVVWHFTKYTSGGGPSCPVLFTHDGTAFVQENPLLTACEESGYVDVVTDYYHIDKAISPQDGRLTFQLKEMEDEITYLYDIELITVDHADNTKVACSIDGHISTFGETTPPLSAIDHYGENRLAELLASDGNVFTSYEPGYLILTFPNNGDPGVSFKYEHIQKRPCEYKVDPNADAEPNELVIEILTSNGIWVELSKTPLREQASEEVIFTNLAGEILEDVITLRYSWNREYSTDAIAKIVPSGETPQVNTWLLDSHSVRFIEPDKELWGGFADGHPLILTKGDLFEFSFAPHELAEPGMTRDYIIRAVGRYQPDYMVFPHLLPTENKLYTNYPNPFNPVTTINYDLPAASQVRLRIYNIAGQLVTTLVDEWKEAGRHQCIWNSKDADGRTVASGLYFYQLKAGDFVSSRKMVLLK
jgi:hypothetical protein